MKTKWTLAVFLAGLAFLAFAPAAFSQNITLGRTYSANDGYKYFTVNGAPTFLKTISYFAALSIDDTDRWEADLRQFKREGINCVRIFANWWEGWGTAGIYNEDCCSAVWLHDNNETVIKGTGRTEGGINYLTRLTAFCGLCDDAGLAVDVSFVTTDLYDDYLSFDDINRSVVTVVTAVRNAELKNVFFDVANEFDVSGLSVAQVGLLLESVKDIFIEGGQDPDYFYLCTASAGGLGPIDGDYYEPRLEDLLLLDDPPLDFLAPHLQRVDGCWNNTGTNVEDIIEIMESLDRRIPIHLQEPFSRDMYYSLGVPITWSFNFTEAAFVTDLKTGKAAGAAGWCFMHQRSQWMKDAQTEALFDNLNAIEISFLNNSYQVTADGSALRAVADFDDDGKDEAAMDFGIEGLWMWDDDDWVELSSLSPEIMIVAQADTDAAAELVVDFGSTGLWLWDGGSWAEISPTGAKDAKALIAVDSDGDTKDEIIADFAETTGVYARNESQWYEIGNGHDARFFLAADVNDDGTEEFIADFGYQGPNLHGLYLWISNAWTQITGEYADDMVAGDIDGDGDKEVVANFGVWLGLYLWDHLPNSNPPYSWTKLTTDYQYADSVVAADVDGTGDDEFLIDLGPAGFFIYNNSTWYSISGMNVEHFIESDSYGDGHYRLIADFGPLGMHLFNSQYDWTQISGTDAEHLAAGDFVGDGKEEIITDLGSSLGVYMGGLVSGVWTWAQISTYDPD